MSNCSVCILCCEEIKIFSCGKCDHSNICFKCSTRLRVLCEEYYCPVCRTDLPKVIFSKQLKQYENLLSNSTMFLESRKFGIICENFQIQADYKALLSHQCKLCKQRPPEKTFDHLKTHMSRYHQLYYCDICIEHLKIFTSERSYYNRSDLARHRRIGDVNNKSHKGHPLCQFCDKRFLDNDELLRHLRQEHYFCHLCDKTEVYKYYSDFESLHDHFKESHFLCEEDDCITEPFTSVFATNIDLKAHKATKHVKSLTKSQAKQARVLDIDVNFKRRPHSGLIASADYEEVRKKEHNKTTYGEHDLSTTLENSLRLDQGEEIKNKMKINEDVNPNKTSQFDDLLYVKPQEDHSNEVETNLTLESLVAQWHSKEMTMVHLEDKNNFPTLSSTVSDSRVYKEKYSFDNSLHTNDVALSPIKNNGKKKRDKKRHKNEKMPDHKRTYILSSVTNAAEREPSTPNSDSADNINIFIDFPSLSEIAQLSLGKHLNPPPPPPPGFSNLLKSKSSKVRTEVVKKHTCTYQYFEPPNFQKRIIFLKDKTMEFFKNNLNVFSKFKEMSVNYRHDHISAEEYYFGCNKLFGASNLVKIYPELIALLPDISKQQHLLPSYYKLVEREKVKNVSSKVNFWNVNMNETNLVSCRVCSQVLIEIDYNSHVTNAHKEDSEFPSLLSFQRKLK